MSAVAHPDTVDYKLCEDPDFLQRWDKNKTCKNGFLFHDIWQKEKKLTSTNCLSCSKRGWNNQLSSTRKCHLAEHRVVFFLAQVFPSVYKLCFLNMNLNYLTTHQSDILLSGRMHKLWRACHFFWTSLLVQFRVWCSKWGPTIADPDNRRCRWWCRWW